MSEHVEQANLKAYGTKAVAEFDNFNFLHLNDCVSKQLIATNPELWNSKPRLLEFAPGVGLLSLILADHCQEITGLDLSPDMAQSYNERAKAAGLDNKLHAISGNVTKDSLDLPSSHFDVAVSSMAFHHLPDIEATVKALSKFLKPNGYFYVVDMKPHHLNINDQETATEFGVAHHHGVNFHQIESAFKNTGFGEIKKEIEFTVDLWLLKTDKMFRAFQEPPKVTRTNKDGETEYKLVMPLIMYSARKL